MPIAPANKHRRVVFQKDPSARLDYGIDWSQWLGNDSVALSSWTVPAGLTSQSPEISGAITTVILSGGVSGNVYEVTNQITTAQGRVEERSFLIEALET